MYFDPEKIILMERMVLKDKMNLFIEVDYLYN